MNMKIIVIVGAGVMGVSAALAAKRRHPEYMIYLVNDATASLKPASKDTSKIIRDAYSDEMYAQLAAEAMTLWRDEPVYRDYWHPSGWIVLHPSANEQSITSGPKSMSKTDFLKKFPDTVLDNICNISEDPKTAWVEASKALEATINLAISAGVTFKYGKVVNLLSQDSMCTGVVLDDGTEIIANSVLLAMGHETTSFLEQCNLPCEKGQRVGISVLGVQLDNEQYRKYEDMPILAVPGIGEILPPDLDKVIKINNARSFLVPDLPLIHAESYLTLDSPYFKENWDLLMWLLPDLEKASVKYCRYCLDFTTTTQEFCIHPVAGRGGLFVATGGSFHGWKFLTNIGLYITKMMDGDERFDKDWSRWAGTSANYENLVHGGVVPNRSF